MKLQFISSLAFALFLGIVLQSASGGRAANGMDAVGAPGSSIACSNDYCHGSQANFANTQITVTVKDSMTNQVVTEYIPGNTYLLEFATSASGSPLGYGMQAAILDSTNTNAGDMIQTTTSSTQLSSLNGREFLEHDGINTQGLFGVYWKAPAIGLGNLTLYAVGLAVNGTGTASGDAASAPIQVTLTEKTTNIQELETLDLETSTFPLPSQGNLTIQAKNEAGDATIQLFDLQGKLVYNEAFYADENMQKTLRLEELAVGVYVLKMRIGKQATIQKINVID